MTKEIIPVADPIRELKKIKNFKKLYFEEFMKGRFVGGENITLLQNKLSEKIGCKYVITTNSGTDALILSINQLNLKEGDEVIVPSFTFFATIEAILHFKLKPVFVDIDEDNLTIDTNSFFENVTKKTKAFLPVHLFGKVFFNKSILDYCNENKIRIVEDVAQAFGTKFENKYLGTYGELGAFSVFPSKTLGGIGDGGFIATNSSIHFRNVSKIKNHGQEKLYNHELNGVNSRLDSMNAYTLIKKLEIFDLISKSRKNLYNYFSKNINNTKLQLPSFGEDEIPNYYSIILKSNRKNFVNYLNQKKIITNIYYPKPIHQQPALKNVDYLSKSLKNSESISKKIVSIPFFAFMKNDEKERIVHAINKYK